MHPDTDTPLAPSQPSLHQRRMALGHLANRAARLGLIEDFIRTAASPGSSRPAGYAVQSPDGTWTRLALTPMAEYLAALIEAQA